MEVFREALTDVDFASYLPSSPMDYLKISAYAVAGYVLFVLWWLSPSVSNIIRSYKCKSDSTNKRAKRAMWLPPAGDFLPLTTNFTNYINTHDSTDYPYYLQWLYNDLVLVINDSHLLKKILGMDDLLFARDWSSFHVANEIFGKSILSTDGEEWRKQHRIMYRAFTSENLTAFRASYAYRAKELIRNFASYADTNEVLDVQQLIYNQTMGVIIDCGFGDSLDESDRVELVELFRYLTKETTNFIHNIPILSTIAGWKFRKALLRFREIGDIAVQRRKSVDGAVASEMGDDERPDVIINKVMIDLLLEASKEDDSFTDEMLRDNILLLLTAGSETTGTTTQWVLYFLSQCPEVYARVMEENRALDLESLEDPGELGKKVPYLTAVIKETLRIRPPLAGTAPRITRKPMVIGDLSVPEGVGLGSLAVAHHFNPENWERPAEFNPDRFLKGKTHVGYFPFGAGRRYCLGKYMAMSELQVVVSYIVRYLKFEFAGSPDDLTIMYRPPAVQPRNGLKMKITVLEKL